MPYVPLLLPELQKALVDPLPEVRAFSARAMGSLLQVGVVSGVCVCVYVYVSCVQDW